MRFITRADANNIICCFADRNRENLKISLALKYSNIWIIYKTFGKISQGLGKQIKELNYV